MPALRRRRRGPAPDPEPADAVAIAGRIGARDHTVFAGALHREHLGLREKVTVGLVRAPDGDYRDWPAVRAWTDHIAAALTAPDAERVAGAPATFGPRFAELLPAGARPLVTVRVGTPGGRPARARGGR